MADDVAGYEGAAEEVVVADAVEEHGAVPRPAEMAVVDEPAPHSPAAAG
jgi:hypothetical protein